MSEIRPVFKKCPTCGSRRIKLVEGDYSTAARGKVVVVHDVRRHECPACGEVLLDYEAVKQIEERRLTARKPRRLARAT
jgi:YgiT-type zinc finger domain-containing protein